MPLDWPNPSQQLLKLLTQVLVLLSLLVWMLEGSNEFHTRLELPDGTFNISCLLRSQFNFLAVSSISYISLPTIAFLAELMPKSSDMVVWFWVICSSSQSAPFCACQFLIHLGVSTVNDSVRLPIQAKVVHTCSWHFWMRGFQHNLCEQFCTNFTN